MHSALQIVAVDMAVYPPSYGVMIGEAIRETEASRLTTRGSIKTRCSDLRQVEDQPTNWQGMQLLRKPTHVFTCMAQLALSKQATTIRQNESQFDPGLYLHRLCIVSAHILFCN